MKSFVLIIIAACLLSGCDRIKINTVDQCLRRELFKECMASIPPLPQSTHFGETEWDQIIEECGHIAYLQSLRKWEFIKEECRSR